jgi:hypothetical protein
MVSAATGTPDRPSAWPAGRWRPRPCPARQLLRAQPDGVAKGGGVLQARCSTWVLASGTSAWRKPTQPASVSSAISVSTSPCRPRVSAPSGKTGGDWCSFSGAELEHLHQAGLVEHGVGVGRADQAGHATGHGGGQLASSMPSCSWPGSRRRAARSTRPGQHDAAGGVDHAVGCKVGGHRPDRHDAARRHRRRPMASARWRGRSRGRSGSVFS